MTKVEAFRLARIIGTADGGCSVCVGNLVDKFNAAGFGWSLELLDKPLFVRNEWDDEYRDRLVYIKVKEEAHV